MKRPLLLFAAAATITAVAAGSLFALTQSASSAANAIAFAAKDNAEGAVTVSVTPRGKNFSRSSSVMACLCSSTRASVVTSSVRVFSPTPQEMHPSEP